MKKYRAGIVGVGFIGAAHIEALRRLPNVEVVALADSAGASEKANSLGVPRGYSNYKDMIEKESLDVVHICTPNFTHCEIALYAMDHNINVICEKPMCCTLEEADRMIAKAKEKGLMNGVNYHNRWYPMTAQLKEMVQNGEFGKIHAVYGEFAQDWLLYDTDYNWRVESSESGSTRAVSDIGTHWLDLIENITGAKVTDVCADFLILHETRKKPKKAADTFGGNGQLSEEYENISVTTEDHANLMFRLDNNILGCAVFSQIIPGRKAELKINIAGIKQSATWCCDTCNEIWLGQRGDYNCTFEKDPGMLSESVQINAGYPGGHGEGFPDAFKNSFRAMYAGIGNPSDNPPYADFKTGRHEILLCDKILESARKKAWVKL
ncbi:Gfo/Idh/MocA family protein [Clostridium sp. Marseille-P3244]|uniref:Gfo/Idh/MocA family protein n=1 Tax=Clostridium sp. Marseille-P3244 TaxID=1871020 RepID=UPI0009301DEF|nr:Gfo/Idh/MocA family oxidoreductase [Clostridium sp. Marseille-P3244]